MKLRDWLTVYTEAKMSMVPIGFNKQPNMEVGVLPQVFDEKTGETKPSWKEYQTRIARPDELDRWAASASTTGIALVCGQVSGGLICYDFDDAAVFTPWCEGVAKALGKTAREFLSGCFVQRTSRGYQVIIRVFKPEGNRKLAFKKQDDPRKKPEPLIETREEGGYCLMPPSVHPSGWVYTSLKGYSNIHEIRVGLPSEMVIWDQVARSLSEVKVEEHKPRPKGAILSRAQVVIDAFCSRHSVADYLEAAGYRQTRANAYVRPDSDHNKQSVYIYDHDGKEVSWHNNTGDCYGNVNLHGRPHDAFEWFQMMYCDNDRNTALARAAAICNIPWDVWEQHAHTQEEPIAFLPGDGNTLIMTDSQEVAEFMQRNNIPVMVGPSKPWDRKHILQVEQFQRRYVVFAGDEDAAEQTAEELDAQVGKFKGGILAFLRQNGIREFGIALLNARSLV